MTRNWSNAAGLCCKPAYYRHTMRKQGSCLEKEIMQGTMPGARRRGRPHTAWTDNIKTWTGLTVEESIRMTEDRDNGESTSMVWPTLGSRTTKDGDHFPPQSGVTTVCTADGGVLEKQQLKLK